MKRRSKAGRYSMDNRSLRKERTGTVVSDRMEKTIVVSLERTVMHPKYRKYLKRRSRVKAHDETNQCHVGDRVRIVECRPLSRDKRWRVSEILQRTRTTTDEQSTGADV
jgi:small subunit ribosomal protein S17